ncbi:MAG: hydrogenase [Spirochaetes bacterium GWD1_27_9]|nr:MAG: hydrogenase [Spirochaetes bacterium GWB1_27_13]OHD23040.1 MAG: hydrogenase [Spirochaetes bacterium GWC1_27_15]OHD41368.1 MAG: hydrogenase [Spirochaetes bacterium GWD1_27_9]
MIQEKTLECDDISDEEKLSKIEELVGKIIDEYDDKESNLIQILHRVQGIYGFLPLNIQKFISEKIDIPLSRVSGVISFYSFFSTKPRGKNIIRICLGTACYVRGGEKIVDKLKEVLKVGVGETTPDRKFSFEVMRCIGACGLAPAIMVNDKVYEQVTPEKVENILNKY